MKLTEWAVLNKHSDVYLQPWTYSEDQARAVLADALATNDTHPDDLRLLSREFVVVDRTHR